MPDVLPYDFDPAFPLAELHPHPQNPRVGDVEVIAESIRTNGFYGIVVARRISHVVLVGWHRCLAANAAGLTTVPVMFIEVDDEHARRILVGDNRDSDLAGYDMQILAGVLARARDSNLLSGTGFDSGSVDVLLRVLDDGPSSYGAVGRGSTPAERGVPEVQSIVLPYFPDDYEAIAAALDALIVPARPNRPAVVAWLAEEALRG